MSRPRTTRALLTGLVFAAGSAQATILFSQPLTTEGGFYSYYPAQMLADDFSIPGGGVINEVTWYGDNFFNMPLGPLSVTFHADYGSGPGQYCLPA